MTPVLAQAMLLSSSLVYSANPSSGALVQRQAYINALERAARAEKTSSITAENLPEPGGAKSMAGHGAESGTGKSEAAAPQLAPRARSRKVSAPDAASTRTKINTTDDGVETLSFP